MRALVSIFALTLCLALVGCGGSGEQEERAAEAVADSHAGHDHAATTAEGVVTLAGKAGCGHCNHHITESCAVVVQTASNELYVVDDVPQTEALWTARLEGTPVTVVGTVSEVDGVHHVAMQSYELGE